MACPRSQWWKGWGPEGTKASQPEKAQGPCLARPSLLFRLTSPQAAIPYSVALGGGEGKEPWMRNTSIFNK